MVSADTQGMADMAIAMLGRTVGRVTRTEQVDAIGIRLDGHLFALASDGKLYFRVDAQTRDDYAAYHTPEGFLPGHLTPPELAWREVPEPVLEDEEQFGRFARAAYEVAKRAGARA